MPMLCLVYKKVSLSTLILFCNLRIWEHISEQWTTFVNYSNQQIDFDNKIGHENFCSGNFKSQFIVLWNKVKSMLLSQ